MQFLLDEILKPVIRRIGTLATGYLIAAGVPQETTELVVTGVSAGALVAMDLFLSSKNRKAK